MSVRKHLRVLLSSPRGRELWILTDSCCRAPWETTRIEVFRALVPGEELVIAEDIVEAVQRDVTLL